LLSGIRRTTCREKLLIGALILVAAAYVIGGAGWLLLWLAAALAVVAGVYFAGRLELFRKSEGNMPVSAVLVMAPYLLGAWLNSRWYTRSQAPAQKIADGIWLGRIPRRAERDALGIVSIVDLTAELPMDTRDVVYRGVPMLDLLTPSVDQIDAAVRAIAELESQRPTLVCCALGYSRSAAAVTKWLLAERKAESVDAAVEVIRARRPSIVLPVRFRHVLAQWAAMRRMT
jgi:protein-tyrosine phosphatase